MASETIKTCDICGAKVIVGRECDIAPDWMDLDTHSRDEWCTCFAHFDICPKCISKNPALEWIYKSNFNHDMSEKIPLTCDDMGAVNTSTTG